MSWEGKTVVAVDRWGASTRLTLGTRLGGGGEGAAYGVDQPVQMAGLAVKIFKDDKQARKIRKVQAMLAMDPEPNVRDRRIAWPLNIIHHDGVPIGYGMIRVPKTHLLDAFQPQLRRELPFNLDLFSLHLLAEDLARTISSLHALNHVVGDLKDTNATFNPDAPKVFLIDTDSYRIKAHLSKPEFRSDAATPHWCPPESGPAIQPEIPHDLFSLAVLYHYLMFSVHPFSGVSSGPEGGGNTVAAIRDGRWLYRADPLPNKQDPPFFVVNPNLQALFRRAFVDGHGAPDKRPTAKDWEEAFRDARYDLKWCDRHPLHVFDGHSNHCPWCRLIPERWATNHQARSVTKEIAKMELVTLTEGAALSEENFRRAERCFAANPQFRKDLPEVAGRLELYKRRQAELDRAIKALRDAEHDDIQLIEVAKQISKSAELEQLARRTFGLGGLLDRAAELEACLDRLTTAVAAAAPDSRGRFALEGEKGLLESFQRDVAILDRSDGLLSRFAPRRVAARERLEAARLLSLALSGGGQPLAPPVEHLRDILGSHGDRLSEIADEDINGAAGKAGLARNIVALSDNLDQPATTCPDEQIVAFWDRHIGPHTSMALQLLDAKLGPDKSSLRAAVDEARQSREAISKFEDLLTSTRRVPGNIQAQDRAILAADPSGQLSARERAIFGATWSGQVLADARRRTHLAERIEQLARDPDRDAADVALLAAWQGTEERDLLGLSDVAHDRIRSAEARMARFDRIRAVANENPPADEQLMAKLAEISPDGDLLGIELAPGQTLRARVERAGQRIGLRDTLAAAMAEAASTELHLEGEEKISSAWEEAAGARGEAASLFAPLSARAEKASLRATCYRELVAALQDQHGGRANTVWRRHLADLSDFTPVMALQSEVLLLLSRYRDFHHLLERAEKRSDDTELIDLAEQFHAALRLKDAGEPLASLDNRSLTQFVAAAHLRRSLRKRLDGLAGLALDPQRLRAELALIADQLPSRHDVRLLDSEFVPQLLEAATAAELSGALRNAITENDLTTFWALWHETWHPLLRRTSDLIPGAQAMVAGALATSSIQDVSMTRIGDNQVRLSWRWPSAKQPAVVGGATNGTEMLTLAASDRQSPNTLDDAQHVLTMYRRHSEEAAVELTFSGDRMAAALFSGHRVGGQPVYARRPVRAAEPRRSLSYRFQAATLRERDDWLLIRSRYRLLTPALRIVHRRSGRTVSILDGQPLRANTDCAINLSQLRSYSGNSARWWRRIQRFMGDELFCYGLELDDPSDQDWIEILHPAATAERQLSFLWQAPIAAADQAAS